MRITFLLLTVTTIGAISIFAQNANEPKELGSLRESYQKARSAALAPIEKKYSDALAGMKERLTKTGNLEGALAVDAELKMLGTSNGAPKSQTPPAAMELRGAKAERLYQELAGSRWSTTNWDGKNLTLAPDGKVAFNKGDSDLPSEVTWSISKSGDLLMSDRGNDPHTATLSSKHDTFSITFGTTKECTRIRDTPTK